MISELDKVQRGLVETTVEFDTQKKVIGVATTNLLPNEKGIVPLSKQGAFQQEQVETIDFMGAAENAQQQKQEEVLEQLDLPVLTDSSAQPVGLQEPVHIDVITSSPVSVESPEDLSGFKIPQPIEEEAPSVMEPVGPVAVDIQMPQMPETIVANEPEEFNANIFEESLPAMETVNNTPSPVNPELVVNSEKILSSIPTTTPTNEQPPMFEPATEEVIPPMNPMNNVMSDIDIQMPLLQEETPVVNEQATVEPVQEAQTEVPSMFMPTMEPVAEAIDVTPVTEAIDVIPTTEAIEVTPVTDATDVIPVTEVTHSAPVVETTDKPIEKAEEQGFNNDNGAVDEYLKLMKKYESTIEEAHRVFIEGLKQIEEKFGSKLNTVASTELNPKENKVVEPALSELQPVQQAMPEVNQINNMMIPGNNLVQDAMNMINAMSDSGPRL